MYPAQLGDRGWGRDAGAHSLRQTRAPGRIWLWMSSAEPWGWMYPRNATFCEGMLALGAAALAFTVSGGPLPGTIPASAPMSVLLFVATLHVAGIVQSNRPYLRFAASFLSTGVWLFILGIAFHGAVICGAASIPMFVMAFRSMVDAVVDVVRARAGT